MYPLVDITIGIMELKKMATSKIKNVNTGEMSDSTKRKNPYSPHDFPDHQKQVSRQTKPRKFSYSADELDKSGINDTNVEQILAKKPGTNIKMNTDQIILDICNDVLKVPITINEIGRTHPIDKIVVVKFK